MSPTSRGRSVSSIAAWPGPQSSTRSRACRSTSRVCPKVASPLPAEFLKQWRNPERHQPVAMVAVFLTDPTSLNLFLATDEAITPDEVRWEPVVTIGPIEARGAFL